MGVRRAVVAREVLQPRGEQAAGERQRSEQESAAAQAAETRRRRATQDVQELTNFFERTTSSYQVGVEGEVTFDDDF